MTPIKFDDGAVVFAEKIDAFWFDEYDTEDGKGECYVHILLSGNQMTEKVESKEKFEKEVMIALEKELSIAVEQQYKKVWNECVVYDQWGNKGKQIVESKEKDFESINRSFIEQLEQLKFALDKLRRLNLIESYLAPRWGILPWKDRCLDLWWGN